MMGGLPRRDSSLFLSILEHTLLVIVVRHWLPKRVLVFLVVGVVFFGSFGWTMGVDFSSIGGCVVKGWRWKRGI